MKKLLFIGIGFHTKTRSCQFVLDLLTDHFDVTVCHVDQYQSDPFRALPGASGRYDVLVCWQIMPPRDLLDRYFKWKHAALFPMYDSASEDGNPEHWYPYRDFNIICFSEKLHKRVSRMGFSSQYIQYFPEPTPMAGWGDPHAVFFWARQEAVNCRSVEKLLQHTDIKKMHVHRAMDPHQTFVEPTLDGAIQYSFSTWFEDRQEMKQLVNDSAFYIAPRLREGIGMSFLEAMAAGRCVIAPDDSTMNEYIVHGKTGYLYDPDNPVPLYIPDVKTIQMQTRSAIEKGYARWQSEKETIISRITASVSVNRRKLTASIGCRTFSRPLSVTKILWKRFF
ncbi:glycosyltransferase [Tichowtungia aerotolerans]|uniref:Glycosyltransferase n=1 Tax=Tichowtungia aerotolerans TaxID=2697043 RepID=A0A6P1MF92_9BACT|nr:glycosyltransferase [Tichowtungia aerotolerans]QHI70286.1 glycosyltransferase [Tichowtungia aerotolerans]